MTHTLFTLILILAVVFCCDAAQAQQNLTDTRALREKAFKLLESAAGQVSSLQSPENRARLGANIADSLWIHDERRARALFALVEEDIRAGMANRDLDDPTDRHTLKVFLKLRGDTVERIAKYDGELALAFLKATEFVSDKPLPSDIAPFERQRDLEIRLAKLMANGNPDLALKLALQSLAQGLSDDLLQVLRSLNKRHKEQAMTLYKEVVKKLRDVKFTDDWGTMRFAESLVHSFRPPTPNDPTFRELIGILVSRALEQGCANNVAIEDHRAEFCRLVASVLPQLERIDPRAVHLKRWSSRDNDVNLAPESIQEFFEVFEDGSIDELVALAGKHPAFSYEILRHAVDKAGEAGDFEQVRKIATDRIADPEKKRELLADIARRQKWNSADDKELAELESNIHHIQGVARRIEVLLSYAARFGTKDRNAALRLLKQATEMADTMKPGREQTVAQLALASQYCSVRSDRGLVIMESLMPKLNELVDAAMKLDGYETGYVRDGEWNMSANDTIGQLLTRLSENAGSFAWCDFDRAVSVAAQFDRTELRLMAQVKLAQGILAGPTRRLRVDYGYIN